MTTVYRYPPLILGKLVKRYKRFLADIELETGEIVTAHCANTGPMRGVSEPNSLVQISKSNNPQRKLAYTWEMIEVNQTWVGINTNLPNKVIKEALAQKLLPELVNRYSSVSTEVLYGKSKNQKSRIDFLLSQKDRPDIYLEVKNVTLARSNVALFPDTVTTRGQKHLEELMALTPQAQAVMLYFINRSDCDRFAPADSYDSKYAQLYRQAIAAGVEILPLRFDITPEKITYLGLADFSLSEPTS